MEPKCRSCNKRPVCPESLTELCWECLRPRVAYHFGNKADCRDTAWASGKNGDRPINYPPTEATS